MTMEPNSTTSDHILDWLEGSVSFFPSFLDEPCNNSGYIQEYHLWDQYQTDANTGSSPNATNSTTATIVATSATSTTSLEPCGSNNNQPLSDLPKKRNATDESSLKPPQNKNKRIKTRPMNEPENGDAVRKNKKGGAKANGSNCNSGNSKEGRWAEQLLNPCAAAIAGGNVNRVQHLLYVLHELASPTGDPNHRLAAHGLRALTHHLSSSSSSPTSSGTITFASTEPRFFQKSLLKFYEVSPWFSFPNNIANASILQVLAEEANITSRTLHILDIGVSHGVQWPTLLDALSRRSGGPPSVVRLTVVTAENDQNMETPFSKAPPGYNYYPRLLGYAQSININLQINRIENHSLQTLNAQSISASPDEILIVCAQFRLHHLNHNSPDERSEFLKVLRNMEPRGVILSENNTECCCSGCGNFAAGFTRRVEYLWRFLDSTSSAFKGRESDERRVMEGEAAKALTNQREMNEEKEKWCGRMKEAGFAGEVFGEDAVDGGRALLRKYDSNWEMKVEEKNTSVGLW
nr:truncated nodulation signaling pathway 1 protein [Lotus japonicus]